MFTMDLGLRGQARHDGLLPAKAARLAALLGALILTSVSVVAFTIFADRNLRQRASTVASCSAVTQEADRLACYDKLAHQPASHLFKGATALFSL